MKGYRWGRPLERRPRGYLSHESLGLVLEDQADEGESEVAALER